MHGRAGGRVGWRADGGRAGTRAGGCADGRVARWQGRGGGAPARARAPRPATCRRAPALPRASAARPRAREAEHAGARKRGSAACLGAPARLLARTPFALAPSSPLPRLSPSPPLPLHFLPGCAIRHLYIIRAGDNTHHIVVVQSCYTHATWYIVSNYHCFTAKLNYKMHLRCQRHLGRPCFQMCSLQLQSWSWMSHLLASQQRDAPIVKCNA